MSDELIVHDQAALAAIPWPEIRALVQTEVKALTPQAEATLKTVEETELARLKANTQLQDMVVIVVLAVVCLIVLAVFGAALAGSLYAQGLVTQAATALGGVVLLLTKAFSSK